MFPEYAHDWLASYNGRTNGGLANSTRAAYKRDMQGRILTFFKKYRVAEIHPADVRAFVTQLEDERLAPSSIKKTLAPLKALCATAVEDRTLEVNPTLGVRVNQQSGPNANDPRQAMTRDCLARVLSTLPDRERLLCLVLAGAGLRISEALGLDWGDVQFGDKPQLHIRRQYYRGEEKNLKTSESRRCLPLPADLAQQFWTAKGTRLAGPIFRTRDGKRLSDRNVRRVLDEATKKAGVEHVTFHAFRHTFASMLYAECKDIRKVSAWLGHSDPAFTFRTYVHLVDDGLGAAPDWNLGKAA
jgi:integrase